MEAGVRDECDMSRCVRGFSAPDTSLVKDRNTTPGFF